VVNYFSLKNIVHLFFLPFYEDILLDWQYLFVE
jgi:hypothetical protein